MKEQIIAILNKHLVDLYLHGVRYGYETNTPLIHDIADEITKVAEAMPTEEGYILYEKAFLSPIKEERAWQEHCLRLLYAEYPNICKWQLMSSLIYHTGIATGITIPSYDEWFRNRMKGL